MIHESQGKVLQKASWEEPQLLFPYPLLILQGHYTNFIENACLYNGIEFFLQKHSYSYYMAKCNETKDAVFLVKLNRNIKTSVKP